MKIKKELLQQFVRETALSGEHSLKEVKLDFGPKGLDITRITEGNHIFIKAQMPASSFEDYSELGKIGLLNYTEFQKVIATLSEDITIRKEGNVLVLEGGRKVEIPLADESLIKDVTKTPDFEYPNTFTANKRFFDEMINNLSFSLNKSDPIVIEFVGDKDMLKATYGTKYKYEDTLSVEIKERFELRFGVALLNAVANIVGDLSLSMKNIKDENEEISGFPMTIEKITDLYSIRLIIAPRA